MNYILTEKSSVANDFALALGCIKCDGYFQNDNYIVVSARGHLYEQYYPEDYNEALKTWDINALPIVPDTIKYKPIKTAMREIGIIKKSIKNNKIHNFIVATDAGREGESIARIIISKIKDELPENIKYKRFWTAEALTKETIIKELNNVKDLSAYDDLFEKSKIRSEIDWLIGINYSRLLSTKSGTLLSFGRVQTPVCFKVYDTDKKIKEHVIENYFELIAEAKKDKTSFLFKYINEENKKDLESISKIKHEILNEKELEITKVEVEKIAKKPPQLYNLNELQSDCNKIYGYTAKETLEIAQRLYETKKVLSYPRTPSRVMADGDYEYFTGLLKILEISYNEDLVKNNINIFNSKKLEDHHALVVLKICRKDELSESEMNVYELVLTRMMVVCEKDFIYKRFILTGRVGKYLFKTSYRNILEKGWTKIKKEKEEEEEKTADILIQEKDVLEISRFDIEEKFTKPPKKETDSSLLKYMEKNGLGTPATRYTMIETLVKRGFLERNKKNLNITILGISFIEYLLNFKDTFEKSLSPEYTKDFEERIEKVDWTIKKETIELLSKTIEAIKKENNCKIENGKKSEYKKNTTNYKCLKCGAEILEGKSNYYCKNTDCKFSISKSIKGVKLKTEDIDKLFNKNKTREITFTSAAGKDYKASLVFEENALKFVFPQKEAVNE